MRALQELPSRRLARRGRTEFDREPDIRGRIVGVGTKEPPCSVGYQLHSLTAARTCAIDDQSANEIGRLQSNFLCHHAADREAKYIELLQAQRLDEGDGVSAHPLERRRNLAGAAGDARVVEQDHLTVASEAILLADVRVDELGLRTERAQLLSERLAGLIMPTGNNHFR